MYLTPLIFALTGAVFGLLLLRLGRLLSRRLSHPAAGRPFESGVDPQVHAWHRFHVRWLPCALLFPLAMVPLLFLYPWVLAGGGPGLLVAFLALFLPALLYAWREGALEWD